MKSSVGAVAAIDADGKLVSLVTSQGPINSSHLVRLGRRIRRVYRDQELILVLDNHRMHYMAKFQKLFDSDLHRLQYTPVYSGQFNPIEYLWAYSKRSFCKTIITSRVDKRDTDRIQSLVE